MYVTYDKETLISTGCSSSEPINEPYIIVDDLSENFYRAFDCYRVNLEDNTVVFDENIREQRIIERNNYLTEEQKLAQENSQLQIDMLKLKMYLNLPKTVNNHDEDYWRDRYENKYVNDSQINELIEMGLISEWR